MIKIKVHKEDVAQILDWIKSVVAIDSAGIAAMVFSAKAAPTTWHFQWAAVAFVVSVILLFSSFMILIEHKRSANQYIGRWKSSVIILGYAAFLAGLVIMCMYLVR